MSDTPVRRASIARSWTHHHEDDHDDRLVYKPSELPAPPARGRTSLSLADDGVLHSSGPGPDDRTVKTDGRWELDGRKLRLYQPGRSALIYSVEDIGPDRLVLRPIVDDTEQGDHRNG